MSQDIEATIDQRPIEVTIGDNTIQSTIGDNIIEATIDQRPINATIGEDIQVDVNGAIVQINGSTAETFETVSKNLKAYPATFNYTNGTLTSIVYTLPSGTITKTLNYTSGTLTSIVLSGDTPAGIDLTKTLGYTSGDLTSITYS